MQKPLTSARNNMHIYRQESAGVGSDCLAAPWSLEIPSVARKINFHPFKVTLSRCVTPPCCAGSPVPCHVEKSRTQRQILDGENGQNFLLTNTFLLASTAYNLLLYFRIRSQIPSFLGWPGRTLMLSLPQAGFGNSFH